MAPTGGAPALPARLGRYEVRSRLAAGAMGEVFEALDPVMGRRVVLKTIRPDLLAGERSSEMLARFQRECRLLGAVAHPNVVTMYDAGRDEATDTFYMVMEHVDGVDLASLVRGGVRFPPAQVRDIARGLARALSAAHAAGIIHRDVKPGNVLLTPAGQVKLTDFGIARDEIEAITARGAHVGTPGYEAPEQARGEQVDARSDLYALGMVLRQLLTGRGPMDPDAPDLADGDTLRPDLAETVPLAPPASEDAELEELVARLRSPDPAGRPADAASVVRQLESGREATVPAPRTWSSSPTPAAPRGRLAAAAVAIAGLLVAATFAWGAFRIVAYGISQSSRILAPPAAAPVATPAPPAAPPSRTPVRPTGAAPPTRPAPPRGARERPTHATPAPEREEQFRQMEKEYDDWSRPDAREPERKR